MRITTKLEYVTVLLTPARSDIYKMPIDPECEPEIEIEVEVDAEVECDKPIQGHGCLKVIDAEVERFEIQELRETLPNGKQVLISMDEISETDKDRLYSEIWDKYFEEEE